MYAWGSNSEGQLGLDVDEQLTPRRVKVPEPLASVACGYYHNVAVSGVFVTSQTVGDRQCSIALVLLAHFI